MHGTGRTARAPAICAFALVLATGALAWAQAVRPISTLPADLVTIDIYYRQAVHDSSHTRIGKVDDLLLDQDGRILVAMVSVGSFLELKRKHVAVPFSALQVREWEHEPYLLLDTDRRALNEAQSFSYNQAAKRWERQDE
jgi:hypothetical protein